VKFLSFQEKFEIVIGGMVGEIEWLLEENKHDPEYIPLIVFNKPEKAHKVDYNFLVHSITQISNKEAISRL